jgi:hypothetical protein
MRFMWSSWSINTTCCSNIAFVGCLMQVLFFLLLRVNGILIVVNWFIIAGRAVHFLRLKRRGGNWL